MFFAVAADTVHGPDLLEINPAEVGAAWDEVAPEVLIVDGLVLRSLLRGLGLLPDLVRLRCQCVKCSGN